MTRTLRVFGAVLLTLAITACGWAQGGSGGGFGGGRIGSEQVNLPGDGAFMDWAKTQNQTMVLSTGDRLEWKIKLEKNMGLWARASSGNVDPALEIFDPNGKSIAKNDDIRDGNQTAQTLICPDHEGEYKVVIKSFKGADGGQIAVSFRTFYFRDATMGQQVNQPQSEPDPWVYRAKIKKDEIVSVDGGHPAFGMDSLPVVPISTTWNSDKYFYRAASDTTVLMVPEGNESRSFRADVVPQIKAQIGTRVSKVPGDIVCLEFDAKPGQVLQSLFANSSNSSLYGFSSRDDKPVGTRIEGISTCLFNSAAYIVREAIPVWIFMNTSSDGPGPLQDLALDLTPGNHDLKLPMGGEHFFRIHVSPLDAFQLTLTTAAFVPDMDLKTSEDRVQEAQNEHSSLSSCAFDFIGTQDEILVFSTMSRGFGGGGNYTLRYTQQQKISATINTPLKITDQKAIIQLEPKASDLVAIKISGDSPFYDPPIYNSKGQRLNHSTYMGQEDQTIVIELPKDHSGPIFLRPNREVKKVECTVTWTVLSNGVVKK
ncbi:MAG: hypothetical protein JST40_09070 [Armatimonadetes bacterium]|nr:hypothetical protein [Armatimonadota bacterium]